MNSFKGPERGSLNLFHFVCLNLLVEDLGVNMACYFFLGKYLFLITDDHRDLVVV